MSWYFKPMATFVVGMLVTISLSYAEIQDFKATFIKGKTVASSYLTIERYSKVQCVEKCYNEGKEGRCSIAEYSKATRSCKLSMDSQYDVLDSSDVSSGVFIYQEPPVTTQGKFYDKLKLSVSNVWHLQLSSDNNFYPTIRAALAV